MASGAVIKPIAHPAGSGIDFGAVVSNVDIENLTGKIPCNPQGDYVGSDALETLGEYP